MPFLTVLLFRLAFFPLMQFPKLSSCSDGKNCAKRLCMCRGLKSCVCQRPLYTNIAVVLCTTGNSGLQSAAFTTISLQFPLLTAELECYRAKLHVFPVRERSVLQRISFANISSDFVYLMHYIELFGIFIAFGDVECISLNDFKILQWSTLHYML